MYRILSWRFKMTLQKKTPLKPGLQRFQAEIRISPSSKENDAIN